MKLKLLPFLLILLIPLANASLEKPNWSVGDYWRYEGNYNVKEDINYENFSFSITLTTEKFDLVLKVIGIETVKLNDSIIGCYKTQINGTVEGTFSLEGYLFGQNQTIEGNFGIKMDGLIYFSTDKLAVVKNENTIDFNISTNVPIPGLPSGTFEITTEYNPPLDFMQFPVNEGEQWTAHSNATLYYQGLPTGEPMSGEVEFSFKCVKRSGEVYIIESNYNPFGQIIPLNNTYLFWNGEKGMIEKIMDTGGNQKMMITLVDYNYNPKENVPPVAQISYSPSEPKVGTKIFFKSNSYDEDGEIVYYLWEFGDGATSNEQNPSHTYTKPGEYKVKLTVIDNYGEESTTTITVSVAGDEGGGKTPGFEIFALIIALLFVIWRRLGNFK